MAAITGDAANFVDWSELPPGGHGFLVISDDIGTDYMSEANDRLNLACAPEGLTLVKWELWENDDGDTHATPTLDGDIVLVQGVNNPSEDGTETVLYNAGTRWQGASTTKVEEFENIKLTEKGYNGKAYIRWKCVAAAATAAAMTVKMLFFFK